MVWQKIVVCIPTDEVRACARMWRPGHGPGLLVAAWRMRVVCAWVVGQLPVPRFSGFSTG
eukprot:6124803-Heterocapsa_arctica.AAC.1